MSKKIIGVSQVLEQLKEGMTRAEIGEHYGITPSECRLLFKDSRLKGRKTIKKPSFVLVDNVVNDITVVAEVVDTKLKTEVKEEVLGTFGDKYISKSFPPKEIKATWD